MADYPVSIEAVRKMLIDLRSSLGNERYISIGLTMALGKLEGFPPMDAVEVVCCKDCRLWKRVDEHHGKCPFLIGEHQYAGPDHFCSMGERKEVLE